jgi:hypothetical protein
MQYRGYHQRHIITAIKQNFECVSTRRQVLDIVCLGLELSSFENMIKNGPFRGLRRALAYHLRKECFLREIYVPTIEMRVIPVRFKIMLVGRVNRRNERADQGQAFVPRLVFVVGAKMCTHESRAGFKLTRLTMKEDFCYCSGFVLTHQQCREDKYARKAKASTRPVSSASCRLGRACAVFHFLFVAGDRVTATRTHS